MSFLWPLIPMFQTSGEIASGVLKSEWAALFTLILRAWWQSYCTFSMSGKTLSHYKYPGK